MPRDRWQDRLAVALGIGIAVQKMDAARTRRGEADSHRLVNLCVAAGGERCGFFMSHQDQLDALRRAGVSDAVDAIPED